MDCQNHDNLYTYLRMKRRNIVMSRQTMEIHKPILDTICIGVLSVWKVTKRKLLMQSNFICTCHAYHSSCWTQQESKAGQVIALADGMDGRAFFLHNTAPFCQPRLSCQLHSLLVEEGTGGVLSSSGLVLKGDAYRFQQCRGVEFLHNGVIPRRDCYG